MQASDLERPARGSTSTNSTTTVALHQRTSIYEVFKPIVVVGGLSSFAGHPEEAAKSLDVLMDEAVRVVPAER